MVMQSVKTKRFIPIFLIVLALLVYLANAIRMLDEQDITYAVKHALARDYPKSSQDYWVVPRVVAWQYLYHSSFQRLNAKEKAEDFLLHFPFAVKYGAKLEDKIELADLLRQKGVSLEKLNSAGCDALHFSLFSKNMDALRYVLSGVSADYVNGKKTSGEWMCKEKTVYLACSYYKKFGDPVHLEAWEMLYRKAHQGQLPESPLTRESTCEPYARLGD